MTEDVTSEGAAAAAPPPAPPPAKNRALVRFAPLGPDVALPCPVCNRRGVTHVSPYPSNEKPFRWATVLYCTRCGTGHVPDADALLGDYYTADYAAKNRRDRDTDPEAYFTAEPETLSMQRYFSRARAQVKALRKQGAVFDRVLDFGSGPGYFLHASEAKSRFAVELDEASAKYLSWLGATRLNEDDLGSRAFDVIVASHVVEHLTATTLAPTIDRLVEALEIGGHMLIEVPQAGHTYLRVNHRQDPHTLFFTPEGLRRAVVRPNLKILRAFQRSSGDSEPHPGAIYTPPDRPFYSGRGGGLTVIATRTR